jgi:hypothetical protein
MRKRFAGLALSGTLALAAFSGVACDNEDERDVEEIGNEIENEVDNLDDDGKDD